MSPDGKLFLVLLVGVLTYFLAVEPFLKIQDRVCVDRIRDANADGGTVCVEWSKWGGNDRRYKEAFDYAKAHCNRFGRQAWLDDTGPLARFSCR